MTQMNCSDFQHHFTYEGKEGPMHWADYCPDCGKSQQSPINIVTSEACNHDNPVSVDYKWQSSKVTIVNNGHTIKVPYTAGSLTYGGVTFNPVQYHFHAPSEHTLDGHHAKIEMHVVHESAAGEIAVLGFMIEVSEKGWPAVDSEFEKFKNVPNKGDEYHTQVGSVAALFPTYNKWYLYNGSFTTPPCTQGVRWFVLSEPSYISQALYNEIIQIMFNNNRPVQPLHGRTVSLTKRGTVNGTASFL